MRSPRRVRNAIRALSAVLLCVVGFVLARAAPFRETTVIVDAGGCRLVTDIVDAGEDETQGSVVLLHGLAANKKIMSYLARGFALMNLRVFVPDMPGHGRTAGPFSFARADTCSESFVRQLIRRGAIDPELTILAGHSMGGAIALRVASRIPVAGTIAFSPAPMVTTYGVPASMLPFNDDQPAPAHTLVLSGWFEPRSVRETARSLIAGSAATTGKYAVIPHSTHVSLLFDPAVARASQVWAAQVLKLDSNVALPSRIPLVGSLAGFLGVLILAGPFLRETVTKNPLRGVNPVEDQNTEPPSKPDESTSAATAKQTGRALLEVAALSIAVVFVLRLWNPFAMLRLFEGDYLGGFLLILGVILLFLHRKDLGSLRPFRPTPLLAAAFAAIVLPLLIYSWFDLTISEAWWTAARWLRFPALFAALLPYHAAEELLLGPKEGKFEKGRLALALSFRLVAWGAILGGLLLLHNREILLLLLSPYFVVFCLLQRLGMDVVRKGTGSSLAAAVFGAILLAGFCVVVFPIT
jgi:pimeloyl-ACP methyl ester carboxylesterase